MEKQQKIEALASDIVENNICAELAASATQLVMGEGSLDADIVFIGEAPGKKEDIEGRPFVGASGKFLNSMLEQAGMERDDVYITNIVKYRPPNNRDPKKSEKEEFWPYLVEQLEIIQPKIIATLGRHSMNYFLPDAVIGDVHGDLFDITVGSHKTQIVPLYHPAAAMYNGKLRQTLVDDFLKIQR